MKKYIRLIFYLIILAIFLRAFILDAFRIPTSSMSNTLLPGDFIIVNQVAYRMGTPRSIPLLDIVIPFTTLLEFSKPKINDVVVIAFPSNFPLGKYSNKMIVKRIVAGPRDTLQILNRKIYVNRKRLILPGTAKVGYGNIKSDGKEGIGIFPKGSGWNIDNYGPIRIPAEGDVIDLKINNIGKWKSLIVTEIEERAVRVEGSVITIKDKPSREYIIKNDHYFVMGDDYDNSMDSRYLGFINEDMILGKAMFIYLSIDPAKSWSDFISKIRWKRIFEGM
jgi:signal peptidase I